MSAQISLSAQRFFSGFVSRISRWVRARLVCLPLCAALLGCLLPVVCAAQDTVTTLLDSGPGSLRDTIANAAAGDTIVFKTGLTGTITLTGTLTIQQNLTIQGPGANAITISGNHAVEVFSIHPRSGSPTSITSSITGVTIANGAGLDGGGISAGGTVTVTGVAFIGNIGQSDGGGIYCRPNSTVTVNDSVFSANSASSGGGIFVDNSGSLAVNNSTFSTNSASVGGGLAALSSQSVFVRNSTFSGNSATNSGGGINLAMSEGALLSNNIFSGNSAGTGGAVFSARGNGVVDHTVFYNNSGGDCTGCQTNTIPITTDPMLLPLGNYGGPTQSMLPQPGSSAICAGLSSSFPTGATTDQRGFPLNASCVDAGAVQTNYLTVTTTADPGNSGTSLRAAITTANNAGFGDIAFQSGLTGTIVLNSTLPAFTGQMNIVATSMNSVSVSGAGSSIIGSIFTVDSEAVAFLSGLRIIGGNANESGGGILNYGTLMVNNSTFFSNLALYGAGIYNQGALTVSNSTFGGGFAGSSGGAIYNSGTLTVSDSTFAGNDAATGNGGAIDNENGTLTVNNSIFYDGFVAGTGGGISNTSGTANASFNVFFANVDAATRAEDDCSGCTTNNNPITADPMLAAFGSYGGPTQTMLPLPGSSAICAGSAALVPTGLTTDQRGFPFVNSRYSVSACVDAGAVQTNYTSIQFSSPNYSGFPNVAVSPAPRVSVTENGQNIGGVPVTLGFIGTGTASGLGPVATTAGVGATFGSLKVSAVHSDTLSAALQITPTFALTTIPNAALDIVADTVQVTVGTSPPGLLIFIDGASFSTAQTQTWNVPSQHNLSVSSVGGDSSTRYNFLQWSDGSTAQSRTVSAVNGSTSYIAEYSTSYKLTVSSSGNGSATPGTGTFFPAGTIVNLTATPNSGYYFTGWAGSNDVASTSSVNTTVTMNGPETITASFAPLPNFVVTTIADVSDASCTTTVCSLRDAITAANLNTGGSANIGVTAGLSGTIKLMSALPALNGQVGITGPVAGNLIVSGNSDSDVGSVFTVNSGATVAITGLTIANGNVANARGLAAGGGIHNSGSLTLSSITFFGNAASGLEAQGGAIFNEASGTLTIVDSTFSGNSVTGTGSGGAIFNNAGTVTVNDSTFSGNSAGNNGGGIFNAGQMALANNIFSGNTAASIGGAIANNGGENETANVSYTVFFHNISGSGEDDCNSCTTNSNVITGDPMLAALGSYGGVTQTLLPLPGSSAICTGLTGAIPAGLTLDQRGLPRLNAALACVDAGAVQTNYTKVQFSSTGYSGTPGQVVSPAPVVSVMESGQSVGGIPITLSFTGAGIVTGLGPVTTVAGAGAAYNSLSVDTAGPDTLLAMVQIAPGYTLSASVPLSIALLAQAINFTQPPSPVTYGVTPIALSATGGASGNPVTFSVIGPCSVLANTMTITGAGSCVITANQAGNATYIAATAVLKTITVNPAVLTVTAASPSIIFGAPLPVYSASITGFVNSDPSTVVSGTPSLTTTPATPSAAGSYAITVSQGTLSVANYSFSFVNGLLTIAPAPQTINFTAPASPVTYGVAPIALVATGGGSTSPVFFKVVSGSCSILNTTVTITGAGDCVIAADQAADTNFTEAPEVTQTIVVNQASQTIVFPAPVSPVTYGVLPITLAATGGVSNNAVTYTVSGPATLNGSTLTITGAGTVTVTASQAGNANYSDATPVQRSITVNQAMLTVTAASPSIAFGAPLPGYTATILGFVNGDASSVVSGSPSLATSPSAPSDAGTYTITAASGSLSATNYSFIFVNGTLSIGLAAQTIHFTAPASPVTYGVSPITLTATGGASGNAVTFGTTGLCSVSSSRLTITGAGNCVITASQLGSADYADASPVSHSIMVNAAVSALTIGAFTPVAPVVGNTVTFSATVSSGAGAPAGTVTFSVDGVAQTPVAATGGTVTANIAGLMAGTHTIGAIFVSGSASFSGATASTVSLTVGGAVAPNAPPILLITTVTYTKLSNGSYQGVVTVTNQGSATAPNVVMTSAKLGVAVGTPAPQTLGDIPSGGSVVKTITYPATAGSSKALVVGQVLGTYAGGSFGGSQRVTLP